MFLNQNTQNCIFFVQRSQKHNTQDHNIVQQLVPFNQYQNYYRPFLNYQSQKSEFQIKSHLKSQILCLSESDFNIFNNLSKFFTIKTNTGSSHFNTYFLKDTSSVISNFLKENPNESEYLIDIDDDENVLGKFEQIYQGEFVVFNEEELFISQKITKLLNIKNCPNFMKPESLKSVEPRRASFFPNNNFGVEINYNKLSNYLKYAAPQTFTIITNSKEYKCNIFGVYSSEVIRKILTENPKINEYVYEYDDEFNEFQLICDLFNYKKVEINKNNMYSIKNIAEDLQITPILESVNKFIESTEKVSQTIDDQQKIIDSIEDLFHLLYNIKKLTVEKVKMLIINSKWIKTKDNVKEFVAFVLHVIKTDFLLQQPILDLLFQLDQEADETNKLDILIPFLTKHLFVFLLNEKKNNVNLTPICSLIYNFYKRGLISKEDLYKEIKKNGDNYFVRLWFFPELDEINQITINSLNFKKYAYIKSFLPDKIDLYKQIRDSGEPDDELTKALRKDDVDTVQRIISTRYDNKKNIASYIDQNFVPFNMFENFVKNGETSLINYAAAYGSIRCFKYLLLNHHEIDENTFSYAVHGCNIEIIKIVDQKDHQLLSLINDSEKKILPSIMKHQNQIFDWIFDQKFSNPKQDDLYKLVKVSLACGNAHSLIEIIDKGFICPDSPSMLSQLFQNSIKYGFFKITQLLINISQKKPNQSFMNLESFECFSLLIFDNISIFCLFCNGINQFCLEKCIEFSIVCKATSILEFILNSKLFSGDENKPITLKQNLCALNKSLECESNEMFNFVIDIIKQTDQKFDESDATKFISILQIACEHENTEAFKTITELFIENKINIDFTSIFCNAAFHNAEEICNYLFEKDFKINFKVLCSKIPALGSISADLFSRIMSKLPPEDKEHFLDLLDFAIQNNNKSLVKRILQMKPQNDSALLLAVETNDLELVNIILEYDSSPNLINRISYNIQILTIPVLHNNLEILQKLLSIPKIDPSLYGRNQMTPLIASIKDANIEMMKLICDFYGDNIKNQKWQINKGLEFLLNKITQFGNENHILIDNIKNEYVQKVSDVLSFLVQRNYIDSNYFIQSHTLLTFFCSKNNIEMVQQLLKKDDIDANLHESNTGNTPLIIAIKNDFIGIAKLLINYPQTNINKKNYKYVSPLMFAAFQNNEDIVNLLINDEKFDADESLFNYAFYLSTKNNISKSLIQMKSLDINFKAHDIRLSLIKNENDTISLSDSKREKIPILLYAVRENDVEKVDLIIQHPSFDKVKSQLSTAIINTIEQKSIVLFRKLIKLADDDCIDWHKMLYLAVQYRMKEIANEIIYCPNFDSKKSKFFQIIEKGYFLSLSENNMDAFGNNHEEKNYISFEIMKDLCRFDKEHDKLIDFNQLLENGRSFLTENGTNLYQSQICKFILENGADPNIPDKFGDYPLQLAIQKNNIQFVTDLIDSNKIDFTKKISILNESETTYLHLASASTNEKILELFLKRKLINVNVTNSLGETPLMIACKCRLITNINMLFDEDDLDYLRCDNLGRDALKIVSQNRECECPINDKQKYYCLLVDLLNFNESTSTKNDTNDLSKLNFEISKIETKQASKSNNQNDKNSMFEFDFSSPSKGNEFALSNIDDAKRNFKFDFSSLETENESKSSSENNSKKSFNFDFIEPNKKNELELKSSNKGPVNDEFKLDLNKSDKEHDSASKSKNKDAEKCNFKFDFSSLNKETLPESKSSNNGDSKNAFKFDFNDTNKGNDSASKSVNKNGSNTSFKFDFNDSNKENDSSSKSSNQSSTNGAFKFDFNDANKGSDSSSKSSNQSSTNGAFKFDFIAPNKRNELELKSSNKGPANDAFKLDLNNPDKINDSASKSNDKDPEKHNFKLDFNDTNKGNDSNSKSSNQSSADRTFEFNFNKPDKGNDPASKSSNQSTSNNAFKFNFNEINKGNYSASKSSNQSSSNDTFKFDFNALNKDNESS